MTTPDDFDPYLNWLGITPHERPIDHYRLLGVERFEPNVNAIAHAAEHRMMSVRQYQTGPRGHHTQQILNELTAAKLCLLDANTKSTYDAVLQGQLSAAPVPPPADPPPVAAPMATPVAVAAPPPVAKPVAEVVVPERHDSASNELEKPDPFYAQSWFPIATVVCIVLIAGVVWGIGVGMSMANRKPPTKDDPVATATDDTADNDNAAGTDDNEKDPQSNDTEPNDTEPNTNEVVIQQEGTGGFNFPPLTATLQGNVILDTQSDRGGLAGWSTPEDLVAWKFNVIRVGFFKVEINYFADEVAAGAKFQLQLGKQQKTFAIRDSGDPGRLVTDELFLFVQRKGQHEFRLQCVEFPENGSFVLDSIKFIPK